MTVNYANVLHKNFDLAKKFVRITQDGRVEVLVRENLNGREQIQLYLIGKIYAKEARLTIDENVSNAELLETLDIPLGSLLPWLKQLRDDKKVKQLVRD